MSWPTDGLPRFVAVEVSGHLEGVGGSGKATDGPEHISVHVLDRAFCHRIVGNFRSEKVGARCSLAEKHSRARDLAQRRCGELNSHEQEVIAA